MLHKETIHVSVPVSRTLWYNKTNDARRHAQRHGLCTHCQAHLTNQLDFNKPDYKLSVRQMYPDKTSLTVKRSNNCNTKHCSYQCLFSTWGVFLLPLFNIMMWYNNMIIHVIENTINMVNICCNSIENWLRSLRVKLETILLRTCIVNIFCLACILLYNVLLN